MVFNGIDMLMMMKLFTEQKQKKNITEAKPHTTVKYKEMCG